MDSEIVDAAVKDLLDKPFIKGFRAGAIKERTGLDGAVITKRLDELASEGRLVGEWELICNSCSHLLAKYPEKPINIEAIHCHRCQLDSALTEADLHKSYFRPYIDNIVAKEKTSSL